MKPKLKLLLCLITASILLSAPLLANNETGSSRDYLLELSYAPKEIRSGDTATISVDLLSRHPSLPVAKRSIDVSIEKVGGAYGGSNVLTESITTDSKGHAKINYKFDSASSYNVTAMHRNSDGSSILASGGTTVNVRIAALHQALLWGLLIVGVGISGLFIHPIMIRLKRKYKEKPVRKRK